MKTKGGSVFGGMLLIAGSCIGAGMLGLPIVSGLSGFYPSLVVFVMVFLFMTLSGLLLVETSGWFKERANFLVMVEHTLGKTGKVACWVLYLFLFYALLIAYISGMGSFFSTILQQFFHISLPSAIGSLGFTFLFGMIVYAGTKPVDLWNRVLMAGKIAAFLSLVFLGARLVDSHLLKRSAPQYALFSLPILVVSFGFQNMVPSLVSYMKGDLKRVRFSVMLGSLFVLCVYVLWQLIVLGIIPLEGPSGILESLAEGKEASQAIVGVLGSNYASYFATLLAFFAILTSFLAQALSLSHFLADAVKLPEKKQEDFLLVFLSLFPPLLFSFLFPNIFIDALNFAGGICAVILFGVLPVLMVWKGRYKKKIEAKYRVLGGKFLLSLLFLFALFVAFFQLSNMLHAPYLPHL